MVGGPVMVPCSCVDEDRSPAGRPAKACASRRSGLVSTTASRAGLYCQDPHQTNTKVGQD
ncbi:hypothetical protein F2Q68_00026677 [Brassica cretica]|uniref:Uncharacterized protein n=1 Tax=Brassica cretica TaxID=69181 RepID=A0A8S9IHY6_BRACR|nr:hypothetical protein F2Q68_00026677 [Brassica cretica]